MGAGRRQLPSSAIMLCPYTALRARLCGIRLLAPTRVRQQYKNQHLVIVSVGGTIPIFVWASADNQLFTCNIYLRDMMFTDTRSHCHCPRGLPFCLSRTSRTNHMVLTLTLRERCDLHTQRYHEGDMSLRCDPNRKGDARVCVSHKCVWGKGSVAFVLARSRPRVSMIKG